MDFKDDDLVCTGDSNLKMNPSFSTDWRACHLHSASKSPVQLRTSNIAMNNPKPSQSTVNSHLRHPALNRWSPQLRSADFSRRRNGRRNGRHRT